jgi:hypothetical protein
MQAHGRKQRRNTAPHAATHADAVHAAGTAGPPRLHAARQAHADGSHQAALAGAVGPDYQVDPRARVQLHGVLEGLRRKRTKGRRVGCVTEVHILEAA